MKNNKFKLFILLFYVFIIISCKKTDSNSSINNDNWDATYQIIGNGSFSGYILRNSQTVYSENISAPWSTTTAYDKGDNYYAKFQRTDASTEQFDVKITVRETQVRYESAYGGNASITLSGTLTDNNNSNNNITNSTNNDATYQIIGNGSFSGYILRNSQTVYSENISAPWITTTAYDKGDNYYAKFQRTDASTEQFDVKMTVRGTQVRYESAYGQNASITISGTLQ